MSMLALAPELPAGYAYDERSENFVNPLQQLLADAMSAAGMPLDVRGSKAELSRRSGVEDAIISNIFNRPRYVPDEDVRQALATALGISRRSIDGAAAGIKGLRVYPVEDAGADRAVRLLEEATASFALTEGEITEADKAKIRAQLDAIEARVTGKKAKKRSSREK